MHHQARVSPTVDGPVRTFSVPQVLFGPGTLSEVGVAARRLGGVRVFVISDPGVVEAGWAHEALTTMDAELSAATGLDALSHQIGGCPDLPLSHQIGGCPDLPLSHQIGGCLDLLDDACLLTNPRSVDLDDARNLMDRLAASNRAGMVTIAAQRGLL